MGRIADLCGEVAAEADEGPDGLILPPETWQRLREDWREEEIEDALSLVHDSLLQGELLEAADSLSGHLVEVLGVLGRDDAFARLAGGEARLPLEMVERIARRVDRLEEILGAYRDDDGPDRRGFDALQRHIIDIGIEDATGVQGRSDPRDSGGDE